MTTTVRRAAVMAAALVGVLCLTAAPAAAHVTSYEGEGPADGYLTTAFMVPHGCEGSPTTRLEVQMADGVTSVKPQPVPGWELSTTTRELDPPLESHGRTITETVDTVIWEGGSLPDDELQMFWVSMKLPDGDAGTDLAFPAVQTCEDGETAWIQLREDGGEMPDAPAPLISLVAADGGHGDADSGGDTAGETAAPAQSTGGDSAGGSDALAVVALVVGALALAVGATALVRGARRPS